MTTDGTPRSVDADADVEHAPGDEARPARQSVGPRTSIAAAEGLLAIEPVLIEPDDHLDAVIRRAGASPGTRVLGVVDAGGTLIGVVTSHDLVASVVGRIAPGALLTRIHDIDGVSEYGRYVEATVARDLMQPPAGLPGTATLADAFHLMYLRGLSGVYLVDATGRPLGYLDGLELAAALVSAD
jgi:CBS domain-containing protein